VPRILPNPRQTLRFAEAVVLATALGASAAQANDAKVRSNVRCIVVGGWLLTTGDIRQSAFCRFMKLHFY
jgi:hypothetical protein